MSNFSDKTDENVFIEKNVRLSNSLLWELQKKAYTHFGPEAWQKKNVPFYLTSNPLIARQYAQIVVGFFRDCLALRSFLSIDLQKTFYILDLGAGTGRFAYLVLNELFKMLATLKLPFKIRYIMTDLVEENIQFWKNHPYFQSFIRDGFLDFAFYDHETKENELHLICSGEKLSAGLLDNPLIILANYFFDTIPHDIYSIKDHILYEGRLSLSYKKSNEPKILSLSDPSLIASIDHHIDYVPMQNWEILDLEDPQSSKILKSYTEKYKNIPYFLIPKGAFQVIQFFRELSDHRLLFLTGDQGLVSDKQFFQEIPFLAKHDTFSMSVNYHAISAYFEQIQGFCLLTSSLDPLMAHMAAVSCRDWTDFPELKEAFQLTLETFGPQDYFNLCGKVLEEGREADLTTMMKLIRLGCWDPINFNLFFSKIREKAKAISEIEREELIQAIHSCWDNFFPVAKNEGAFVMNLGILFYDMQNYDEAIRYFLYAFNLGYAEPQLFKNISLVYQAKNEPDKAKIWFDKGWKLYSLVDK
jgi:hypothetical protein